ncbi:exodeoxyribonuclease V subunit beta [Vibrio sp. WJH972]
MGNQSFEHDVTLLQPMTFPLFGARLIEASAGTGKTYTIASLYIRLLLGHGGDQYGHGRPLSVEQILVVTFTEAATAELKGRIRQRIHASRLAFLRGSSHDAVIQELLDQVDDHQMAAMLLLNAEREMDAAAIFTIHGFCQRMLVQNAFESGARFENEFITDETRIKSQVVADYWRSQFYPLPMSVAKLIRSYWPTPNELYSKISGYLGGKAIRLSVPALDTDLESAHQQNLNRIEALKQQWREESCVALEQLQQALDNKVIDLRSYTKKNYPNWCNRVSDWANSATEDYVFPDALQRFSESMLIEKTRSGEETPSHALFTAIETFLAEPISLEPSLLAHAISTCRDLLEQAKQQKQWLSFDDLLLQLSNALDVDQQEQLTSRIRELFPVALIDEFQDTDPLQYSIFSRIYLPDPSCGLFMIGDPKQAIYAFRGADIFTYIQARNQVVNHYTLGKNWRSSAEVINGINQLFARCSAPFIYQQDIPFYSVESATKPSEREWLVEGDIQPAVTFWCSQQDLLVSRSDYNLRMAEATAAQIQSLLTASDQGQVQLKRSSDEKAITPNNIAVLVRTGYEGQMVKHALTKQGIASVYLSNQESVFSVPIAVDVLRLLQAVHLPDDERLVRSALASASLDLPLTYIDELNYDESLWESVNLEFRQYRELWEQRGVLPMLRAILNQRQLAQQWLAQDEGERLLTDYLHLGELLQNASVEFESDVALIRWFSQSIEDSHSGLGRGDEQILRLESEDKLVQIVTIHKSKGLEYDIVFLPFAMNYREASEAKYHDSDHNETILDLNATSESREQAEKERLAEDLRLLYVAVTRAVYACYIGVEATLKPHARKQDGESSVHRCALGYLLQDGQAGKADVLHHALNEFVNTVDHVALVAPPELTSQRYVATNSTPEVLDYSRLNRAISRNWRMTSYSNLVKQHSHGSSISAEFELPGLDVDSAAESDELTLVSDEKTIFSFPKGARPGTFLHALFEEIEFTLPANSDHNRSVIEELMLQEQLDPEWFDVLAVMIDEVMSTPLDGKRLKLGGLAPSQRLVEMEFLLPIELLDSPQLNRVISRYDSLSQRADELGFVPVQGMLKGFIDLVFEYQGRYYILDWKSNHLGNHCEDYEQAHLDHAMIDHRYDLQYQLYTLALHRFLASRIIDYDYETHFGGVYYLFLRGVTGGSSNGIFSARPKQGLINELDAWLEGRTFLDESKGQLELGL